MGNPTGGSRATSVCYPRLPDGLRFICGDRRCPLYLPCRWLRPNSRGRCGRSSPSSSITLDRTLAWRFTPRLPSVMSRHEYSTHWKERRKWRALAHCGWSIWPAGCWPVPKVPAIRRRLRQMRQRLVGGCCRRRCGAVRGPDARLRRPSGLIFPDCTFRKYKPTSFMSLLKPVVGRVLAAVKQIPLSERRRLRRPFGSKFATASRLLGFVGLRTHKPKCRGGPSLRIYSDGTFLTTDRVSSGGLHSGSGYLGGSLTTICSLGLLITGWSTCARVA